MTDKTDIAALAGLAINNNPQPLNITFPDGSQLNFPVSGKASFCGDVEESAKVFFDSVLRHRDAQLEAERQRADRYRQKWTDTISDNCSAGKRIKDLEAEIAALKGDQVPVAEIKFHPSTDKHPCMYWFGKQDRDFPAGTQFFTAPQKLTDLPYDVLFNAIAKSATPLGEHMSISVKDFKAAIETAGGWVCASDERLMQDMSGIARVGE